MGQENLSIFNPAFDVTPVEYVSAVITERGVIRVVSTSGNGAIMNFRKNLMLHFFLIVGLCAYIFIFSNQKKTITQ